MQMMVLTEYERIAANAKARPCLLHGCGKQKACRQAGAVFLTIGLPHV